MWYHVAGHVMLVITMLSGHRVASQHVPGCHVGSHHATNHQVVDHHIADSHDMGSHVAWVCWQSSCHWSSRQ